MSKDTTIPPLFTPFSLREITFKNRIMMSPMCMYSAKDLDGTPNEFHIAHLGARALGGAGLICTEMTQISPNGRISLGDAGIWDDKHIEPWKRVVDFVHQNSEAKIALQLGHAGRKGCNPLSWERTNPLPNHLHWEMLAPSAIPFGPNTNAPREMNEADMASIKDAFVSAAKRADKAGFDMIELHCGHGYLLSSFISPLSNHRDDIYGGSIENRMKFPLEIYQAVRTIWPEKKPISARISAVDWVKGGNEIKDAITIAAMFNDVGLDILDVSSGNVTHEKRPPLTGLFQTPLSATIRNNIDIPTITVGNITTGKQANEIISESCADICAIGKGHLYDPFWSHHAARELGYTEPWPKQYLAANNFRENNDRVTQ